jgi:hypothetical protein
MLVSRLLTLLTLSQCAVSASSFAPSTSGWKNTSERLICPSTTALRASQSSSSSSSSSNSVTEGTKEESDASSSSKNTRYIEGLLDNLSTLLDKYVLSGSPVTREAAYNVLRMIEAESQDNELVVKAERMARRAGLPAEEAAAVAVSEKKHLGATDASQRKTEADIRRQWEAQRLQAAQEAAKRNPGVVVTTGAKELQKFAKDKASLQNTMANSPSPTTTTTTSSSSSTSTSSSGNDNTDLLPTLDEQRAESARAKVSEIIAKAGAASAFRGDILGIGGTS